MSEQADGATAAQGLFRHIVQHGPVAMVALDPAAVVLLASREAVHLLGWDPKGHPFTALFDDADQPAAERYLVSVAPGGPETGPDPFVGALRRAGGRVRRTAQVTGRWLPTAPGGPVTVVALLEVADPGSAGSSLPLGSDIDRLTGLPNRSWLFRHLEQACQRDAQGSVAFIDLDRFRTVNERFGRDTGDQVLRAAGRRLAAGLPPDVLVARIGGDEFVVLLPLARADEAVEQVEAALAALSAPLSVGGQDLAVTASAGVASLTPGDSDLVLRQADAAMYEAKKVGAGAVVVYGPHVALWAENLWDLAANVARLEHDRSRLQVESRTDVLTGLPNLRALGEATAALSRPGASGHEPLSVLFVDLDHFGLYNKRQGDSSGDAALRLVAEAVSAACREGDTAYRKGGEELVLLLPRTTHVDALAIAERLRSAVEELQIPHDGHPATPILTITVGVATAAPGDPVDHVQAAAANAALRAKVADQRNRTVSAQL